MTEQEQLIQDVRDHLSQIQKGAGSIDPMSVANKFGASYSIAVEEICALVIKEADAAGACARTRQAHGHLTRTRRGAHEVF
ncbi:hypothetical protein SAMN05443247_08721 [Bradyrhizobium erythrophlei]|nr:hypothetical protein SAMN05443247_08721 [Bradyrhizobium erythrophlei]